MIKLLRHYAIYIAFILITVRLGFLVYILYGLAVPIIFIKKKLKNDIVLMLLVVVLFFLFKIFIGESIINAIETFKYYFGFLLFLVVFSVNLSGKPNDLYLILALLMISVVLEYYIINYNLLPVEYWFNVTRSDGTFLHEQTLGSMRPYGVAKNATMTTTIAAVLFTHVVIENRDKYIGTNNLKLIVIFLLFIYFIFLSRSGMGYFLTILVCFFLLATTLTKKIIYTPIFILLFGIAFYMVDSNLEGFSRFSLSYVMYLIDFKMEQFFVDLKPTNYSYIDFIFGAINQRGFNNDTGWIPFFYTLGVFGLLFYILIILKYINIHNSKSLLLLLVAAWHYPAIFSIPGQILFAYLLSRK